MKKFFFTALIAVSVISSAFAKNETAVGNKVLNAFSSEFNSATNVNWTVGSQFAKASFVQDGKNLDAFYNFSGEMIGLTHPVSFESLPAKARKTISKKYDGYKINEVLSYQGNEEAAYYISAENDTKKVILKVANNYVSLYKKTNKK